MSSTLRVFLCCLLFASTAFSITPSEAVTMPCVFEDFTNNFGDKDEQNSLGAAKGIIENGTGKAYLGGGYWYGTCDNGSSLVNAEGASVTGSKVKTAIDEVERCMHVIMTTSTSDDDYPYAAIGSNATDQDEDVDVSAMESLIVTAKGSGTVRVNLITRNYIENDADWGFYGADITLTAAEKTFTIPADEILPVEWSYGDPDGDGEFSTWIDDGAPEFNKIEFQVKDGDDAELYLYKVEFGGMTYGDCGFDMVGIAGNHLSAKGNYVNALSVTQSEINFTVAQPQQVSVGIFNVAGSPVANLYRGNAGTGRHTVSLNGNTIANGNYFIVVKGEQFTKACPYSIVR